MICYVAMSVCMCYLSVSATSAAGVLTSNPGLNPVAFIPSGRRHRGGLHWRANDGWRITKRRKAVGAVLLALALLRRLNGNVSELAQLERTRARDILKTLTVTTWRLPRSPAGPRRGVGIGTDASLAVKIKMLTPPIV